MMIAQDMELVPWLQSRLEQLPAGNSLHFTQIAWGISDLWRVRWPRQAEEIYGSLRQVVKPFLKKMSVAARAGTASLKLRYFSLVPPSLKKWYPRSLLPTPKEYDRMTRPRAELRRQLLEGKAVA